MSTLKEILQKVITVEDYQWEDELCHDIDFDYWELNIKEIPEEEGEPLDMENFNVVEINSDEIRVVIGGDWQKGAMLSLVPDAEFPGTLKVTEVFRDIDWTKLEYMSLEEIYDKINLL